MLAHVEKKNSHSRKDERRLSPSEAEKLKVPLPAIGHGKEHKRQHKQQNHRSSKDGRATKGIGRDVAIDGLDDSITDDVDAAHMATHGTRQDSDWQTQTQHIDENDLAEFEDIDDVFVYQALGDQQIEAMKQRLAGNTGYKSTDKYIEGDSYPDTTSGHLTDNDGMNAQDDFSTLAAQKPVMIPMPRTRSAGEYAPRQTAQMAQQSSGIVHDPSIQRFFNRPDDMAHGDGPSFQMPAVKRGHLVKQPIATPSQQARPVNRANIYQQARAPSSTPAEVQAKTAFARGTRFKEQHPPRHISMSALPATGSDHLVNEYMPREAEEQAQQLNNDKDTQLHLLDHDLETLHKMEYKQLKEEAFEHNLHAVPFTVHLEGAELSDRLVSLASKTPDDWSHFFYSLDIDKWEEAGDWFIDRYSAILTQLKDSRRQRRSAAQAFELEVEQRHQAVVNKRIAIRNTIESMRTYGAQVLITPSKSTG